MSLWNPTRAEVDRARGFMRDLEHEDLVYVWVSLALMDLKRERSPEDQAQLDRFKPSPPPVTDPWSGPFY